MKEGTLFKLEKNFITVDENMSIKMAIKKIRKTSKNIMVFYVYVIDKFRVLRGVLPLRNLLLASEKQKVKDIMIREPIVISEKQDDEEIAEIFKRTKFLALPVVDDAYRIIGIITYKYAVDVIESESVEDVLKIRGADIHVFDKSIVKRIKIKLPWLITTVVSGILCGIILDKFQVALKNIIALAFFIPLITAMGESVAGQASAIIIEGLVLKKVTEKNMKKIFLTQTMEGLLMGLIITFIVFIITLFWLKSFLVMQIVSLSIFLGIIVATMNGTLGPVVLKKVGLDPAASTNPLVFAITDITILIIYFGSAVLLIK